MMHVNDPAVVERLMRTKGTWAIVGLSTNEWRSAYDVSLYVRDKMGMEIIPVNLKGEDVHGEKGYKSLADIPADKHPIDVVDCFVNSGRVGAVIDEAIAVGAKAVWLQLGVFDDDACQRARDAGLDVVVNSCPAREGWHYGL
ncbi:CoA-binding protein [Arthrobacter sp. TES]|uniref:CoA-binding protein n=1 Tax=Paenarthrobacter ureafaciens TaxID=37931 RepID=A0AAX3EJC2_PAEUR|nr:MULTISPECIES: CoA-binding protein [Paenarthrobacter]AOY72864.1 CoA-binding protein [Arthrobacter sp. ZXY-2]ERI38453.1 CoA-binding protein [Arthrobacter sp. AK-YN10]NKR11874.1 CoA-binding protein [Arthrobacter sp. M5]NKR15562.1 CoA-binding protein [Arthrobacter sp. M6]OEH58550.1 CoA-binding protein [Arthrobacter sp. D4]OEH64838.1 CoA-binding protein [Arthrobacter sp. D2]QOI64477.1 CoA-binding protein [Arthrobacter sp. TES]BCW82872.1 CoA-binding protein [Arthrobacter sp. NicSoilE8]